MDDYIEILTGDFLKNSGIVAFIYLLKEDHAKEMTIILLMEIDYKLKKNI
ncbi:MAG: hypothetical protein ACLSAL_04390 [Thomasclavelia spiroformis]